MLPVENAKAFNAWLKYWVSTAASKYSELTWLQDTLYEIQLDFVSNIFIYKYKLWSTFAYNQYIIYQLLFELNQHTLSKSQTWRYGDNR